MVNSERRSVDIRFQLSASALRLEVGVRLRGGDGRWIAATTARGRQEIGLGATPREALTASLASIGKQGVKELLADPQLFGVSAAILGAA
jgi:hypothetical protein